MREISTPGIPESDNPLSRVLRVGNEIHISGTTPDDVSSHDIRDQTEETMDTIGEILRAAGASFDDVYRMTVYLKDLGHKDGFNDVYEEYVSEPYPTRAVIGVSDLGGDTKKMLLEIETEAILEEEQD